MHSDQANYNGGCKYMSKRLLSSRPHFTHSAVCVCKVTSVCMLLKRIIDVYLQHTHLESYGIFVYPADSGFKSKKSKSSFKNLTCDSISLVPIGSPFTICARIIWTQKQIFSDSAQAKAQAADMGKVNLLRRDVPSCAWWDPFPSWGRPWRREFPWWRRFSLSHPSRWGAQRSWLLVMTNPSLHDPKIYRHDLQGCQELQLRRDRFAQRTALLGSIHTE